MQVSKLEQQLIDNQSVINEKTEVSSVFKLLSECYN